MCVCFNFFETTRRASIKLDIIVHSSPPRGKSYKSARDGILTSQKSIFFKIEFFNKKCGF